MQGLDGRPTRKEEVMFGRRLGRLRRSLLGGWLTLALTGLGWAQSETILWHSPYPARGPISPNLADGGAWALAWPTVARVAADGSTLFQSDILFATGLSSNPADGSCWLICRFTGELIHLGPEGQEMFRRGGFTYLNSVSVDPVDGSCWVADSQAGQVVHVSAAGGEIWRGSAGTLFQPAAVSVDPRDGSCWVGGGGLARLGRDGGLLWQGSYDASLVSVNPTDGSCWATHADQLVRLAQDGAELSRVQLPVAPRALSANPDGSCWVTGRSLSATLRLSATGEVLASNPLWGDSIAADYADGSCWVGKSLDGIVRLAADSTELWRNLPPRFSPNAVAVTPRDGSCWVTTDWSSEAFHFNRNGEVWWHGEVIPNDGAYYLNSVAVDTRDGSCWISMQGYENDATALGNASLVHTSPEGRELWRGEYPYISDLDVNSSDGSVWLATGSEAVHLDAGGTELWRGNPGIRGVSDVAVDSRDGSVWLTYQGMNPHYDGVVVHLSAGGTGLFRTTYDAQVDAIAVNPKDGSVWVAVNPMLPGGFASHLSAQGEELQRLTAFDSPISVAVDPRDGSCWVGDMGRIYHLSGTGQEISSFAGPGMPFSLAVNASDGTIWIADAGWMRLVHYGVPQPRFYDVPFSHWAYAQIEACVAAGIVFGYADASYKPGGEVSRGAMAVFISRALAGGDASVPPGPDTPSFPDVLAADWDYKYVEYAKAQEVVGGFSDGSFRPEEPADRAQMAVFIARAVAGGDGNIPPGPATPSFPDVPQDFWAYDHVEYLCSQGVVGGYDDGRYHPEYLVTRDQMAVFVQRAFGLP